MKRYMIQMGLSALVWALASCQPQEMPGNLSGSSDGEGEKVTFDMTFSLPAPNCATRALGAAAPTTLRNIYVAVFGSSHYLNEFVKAIPYVTDAQGHNSVSVDAEGNLNYEADGDGKYRVRITLTKSANPRYVHILANVDDTGEHFPEFNEYENEVMLNRIVAADDDGYWQYIPFPNGIDDDAGQEYFQDISLIRNFAQVEVVLLPPLIEAGWTLRAFSVYNTPSRGVFPVVNGSYSASGSKIYAYDDNYNEKSFFQATDQAKDLVDAEEEYCDLIEGMFVTSPGSTLPDETDSSPKFAFENPMHDGDRTSFVIAKMTKTGEDARTKYFRLDFRSPEGELLPLLRNYWYRLKIGGIGIRGYDTPGEAAEHPSMLDVFAEVDKSQISRLDNGISLLQVEYVEKVFTKAHSDYSFEYLYRSVANDASTAANADASLPDGNAIFVADETAWKAGGSTTGATFFPPGEGRRMLFDVNAPPSEGQKVSTFRIFKENAYSLLQQTIRIICMRVLTFDSTLTESGGVYTLSFTLPEGLPRGMFPITFEYEQPGNKISPHGAGTTVEIGDDGVFRFEQELTYEKYLSDRNVQFQFKAVKTIVSGDRLLMRDQSPEDQDAYFVEKVYDLYSRQVLGTLAENLNVSPSTLPLGLGQNASVSFKYLAGVPDPITVTLVGLEPADGETRLVYAGTPGVYSFTPRDGNGDYSFNVKTSSRFSECSVTLSKSGYDEDVYSGAIARPTTFLVPSGALRATGNRPNSSSYFVAAYTSSAFTTTIDANNYRTRFTTTGVYSSRDDLRVDLTRYGADKENGSVYFNYSDSDAVNHERIPHYATVRLDDMFDGISQGVNVNFTNTAP